MSAKDIDPVCPKAIWLAKSFVVIPIRSDTSHTHSTRYNNYTSFCSLLTGYRVANVSCYLANNLTI